MQNTRLGPNDDYYRHLRMELLSLIAGRPKRVLEIGCGQGEVLSFLKRQRAAEFVAGVELVPSVAEIARQNSDVDLILTGDVEQLKLEFPTESFDLIIASHVIEHVKDPWSVTRTIRGLLQPNGQFIGSIPNIRHAKISLPLIFFGKLEYTDEGILDWTHTKFFTKSTISNLLHSSGFSVEKLQGELSGRAIAANKVTFGLLTDFLCFTYNFSARPSAGKLAHMGMECAFASEKVTPVPNSRSAIVFPKL